MISLLKKNLDELRIIKSTFNSTTELPKFNDWLGMFKDGIKIYIVLLVYIIPVIFLAVIFSVNHLSIFLTLINNPASISIFIKSSAEFIIALIGGKIFASYFWSWVSILILILYLFITIPIQYIGIANMVKNNSKLSNAFSFREIFHKISNNGLKNLIIWYIAILIPFSIVFLLYQILHIGNIYQILHIGNIYQSTGYLLLILIVSSYFAMYFYRLLSLFYMAE